MVSVLILSPVIKGSGNYASVCRLRCHIQKDGFKTMLASPDQFQYDCQELRSYIASRGIGLILAIHAYKSGQLLVDVPIPHILVLGGTDVNVDSRDDKKMRVMTEAIRHAGHVVAFSEELMLKFCKFWPDYNRQQTSVIPQAVSVEPSDFKIKEYIMNKKLGINPQLSPDLDMSHNCAENKHYQLATIPDMKIFIVVGGIRPVKNPLFIVKEFSEWREKKRPDCFLVFVGPEMDGAYFEKFKEEINRLPGIVHIDRLEPADTHAAIRDSVALVNSSDSEGMSLAILEAMCLDTPVVVRDIPGNTAIVEDGNTGLVYNTAKEYLHKIEHLLDDRSLIMRLTQNARNYISSHHSLQKEEMAYVTIVKKLL